MRESTNSEQLDTIEMLFKQACMETLVPNWFGEIVIKLPIVDGTIQREARVSIKENRRGDLRKKKG